MFGACASAGSVPLMEAIGIGWASTIGRSVTRQQCAMSVFNFALGVSFILLGGVLTLLTAKFATVMQQWVDRRIEPSK